MKLTKSPSLAVAGESSTKFIGRLSESAAIYGKTFRLVNLSRKELQVSLSTVDWPTGVELLYPETVSAIAAGQTLDIPVTVSSCFNAKNSECLHLRLLHRNVPMSHLLSFKVNPSKEHFEGPLLTELYEPGDVLLLTKLRKPLNEARTLKKSESLEMKETPEETVSTVVNMLKDEVECLCSVLLTDANVQEKAFISQLQAAQILDSSNYTDREIEENLIDSVHTAIDGNGDIVCYIHSQSF
ncbi:unnamed protein product [Strongylus vulgaris]|uniref:Uncharacterized protein n=1 Tax=Strongylus vulgaris TaxID=40348 RepID=A0A3P7I5H6_STRVU|nr:unnamed protein product [Strongylus vulgaris]